MLFLQSIVLLVMTRLIRGSIRFYVGNEGACSVDCDGSLFRPFSDLFSALKNIDMTHFFLEDYTEEVEIFILETNLYPEYPEFEEKLPSSPSVVPIFFLKKSLNLTIFSYSDQLSVNFDTTFLSIMVPKGALKFENIKFVGRKSSEQLLSDESNRENKFITFSKKGNSTVTFKNCKFLNKFIFPPFGYIYGSLISFDSSEENQASGFQIALTLISVDFIDNFFPYGMIISENKVNMSYLILMRNCSFINYNSGAESKLLGTEKNSSEFCLTVDSFFLIDFLNVTATDSSRLLLAREKNFINITNGFFTFSAQISRKPELFFFQTSNVIYFTSLIFKDFHLEGRDDLKNSEPDAAIVSPFMEIVGISDNERIQSCIKLLTENTFHARLLELDTLLITKKNNMYLSFFCAEYKNKIKFEKSSIKNIFMDSLSNYGVTLLFLFLEKNFVEFYENRFLNMTANTFSVVLCMGFLSSNNVTSENDFIQNINFKHKSRQIDVQNFYNSVGQFGESSDKLLFLKSESLKVSCFAAYLYRNSFRASKVMLYDVLCLGNCFLTGFILNMIDISELQIQKVEAELVSSAVLFQTNNRVYLRNCVFADGKSVAGVIFIYIDNQIIIEKCRFLGNIASSVVGKTSDQSTATAGNMYIGYKNTLEIYNSTFFENQCDLYGGSATLNFANNVSVYFSYFQSVQSTNKNARGGVFMVFENNHVKFTKTNFTSNLGYVGGVMYAIKSNNILFQECMVNKNFALIAGFLYLEAKNLLFLNFSTLLENEASATGLFRLNSEGNLLEISSCVLKRNKAMLRYCLIVIEKNCSLVMRDLLIDYSYYGGMSSLIWSYKNISIYIANCSILAAIDVYSVIAIETACYIFIIDTLFSSINTFVLDINYNNKLVIISSIFNTSVPAIQNRGLIFLDRLNFVELQNCNFTEIVGTQGIGTSMSYKNYVSITNCLFSYIYGELPGGLFYLNLENYLNITNSTFYSFEGFRINSIIATLFYWNFLVVSNSSFKGTVNPMKTDCAFILISGESNEIILKASIFFMKKNGTNSEILDLIATSQSYNKLIIINNYLSILNFTRGVTMYGSNRLLMLRSTISNCVLDDKFFDLNGLEDVKLNANTISSSKIRSESGFLLKISDSKSLILKNIKVLKVQRFLKIFKTPLAIFQCEFLPASGGESTSPTFSLLNSSVSINRTNFLMTQNAESANIFMFGSNLFFSNSKALLNKGKFGGLALLVSCHNISLVANDFYLNIGESGAVFHAEDTANIVIEKNIFFKNRAHRNYPNPKGYNEDGSGGGGCFLIKETDQFKRTQVKITSNKFIGNSAEKGSVYFIEGVDLLNDLKSRFKESKNDYKKNKVSEALQVHLNIILAGFNSCS